MRGFARTKSLGARRILLATASSHAAEIPGHKFFRPRGGAVRRYQDFDESLRRWIWQTSVEECKKHGKVPVEPELTPA